MDCYNGTELYDDIDFIYHRIINANFFIGSIILITTLTNMTLLCGINKKMKELKNIYMPPLYKVDG